jgi:hypothetical protein
VLTAQASPTGKTRKKPNQMIQAVVGKRFLDHFFTVRPPGMAD